MLVDDREGYTPTPVISHVILGYNSGRTSGKADGIVVTPSHNPPEAGGFKYNPPHGDPAETGRFAVRPSGTEDVYKLYAESFRGHDHLHQIQAQAQAQDLVAAAFSQS